MVSSYLTKFSAVGYSPVTVGSREQGIFCALGDLAHASAYYITIKVSFCWDVLLLIVWLIT